MEEREYIELRSEEVQEILGTPPGWLVRWGTLVLFICFSALIGVAAIISYPDIVQAKIVISAAVPSVDIVAKTDGRFARFFAKDKVTVKQGTILAIIQSDADYNDVRKMDAAVKSWQTLSTDSLIKIKWPQNLEIGAAQASYAAFIQDVEDFRSGSKNKNWATQRTSASVNRQIDKLETSIADDKKILRRLQEQIANANETYREQIKSFDSGLISRVDLEKAREYLDNLKQQQDDLENKILSKQNEIISLGKTKSTAPSADLVDENSAAGRIRQSLNALRTDLETWKQTYLIIAPVDGIIALNSTYFSEKQYVRKGDQVLSIVPPQSDKLVGRLSLPLAGSGKVRPGQRVIIKLDSYPYFEFGTIRGLVISKSLVSNESEYSILVSLPEGLHTSYRRDIIFEQQLQGKAEIVTEEKQFLQRIYEQVFAPRR